MTTLAPLGALNRKKSLSLAAWMEPFNEQCWSGWTPPS